MQISYKGNVIQGVDGTTFTPQVSEDGVLSWTNDGGLENPEPVTINGANGDAGNDGKTAYQYAVDGGYTGTEAEFQALMADAASKTYVDESINGAFNYIQGRAKIVARDKSLTTNADLIFYKNKLITIPSFYFFVDASGLSSRLIDGIVAAGEMFILFMNAGSYIPFFETSCSPLLIKSGTDGQQNIDLYWNMFNIDNQTTLGLSVGEDFRIKKYDYFRVLF